MSGINEQIFELKFKIAFNRSNILGVLQELEPNIDLIESLRNEINNDLKQINILKGL